jgi:hypothetical protein
VVPVLPMVLAAPEAEPAGAAGVVVEVPVCAAATDVVEVTLLSGELSPVDELDVDPPWTVETKAVSPPVALDEVELW